MSDSKKTPYRVLARKYRPQNFDELIGQDALVRTLKNAIESGRIAHAFMLTGVRGVGKTTTARIIAKALNYTGADGKAGPSTGPTDDCALCKAIAEDRHPDVLEIDAASNTKVEQMRDLLDGVRYAPVEARYKIYIIDEVHMLSTSSFNALLKTLEEPPSHVKFIFATTEIRKVPVTVLSRCQRFDLRRVDIPTLVEHFKKISKLEKVEAEEGALLAIARAADGSVRDGLSLLDQAIALGQGEVKDAQVQDMLGLGDKARNLDIMEQVLGGDMPGALSIMDDLKAKGADAVVLVQDFLDITHALTRLRSVPGLDNDTMLAATGDIMRMKNMAERLSMPTLTKSWQILLKGLNEITLAPDGHRALQMLLIRLAYAADLPDPADLIRQAKNQGTADAGLPAPVIPTPVKETARTRGESRPSGGAAAALAAEPVLHAEPFPSLDTLEDIVALLNMQGAVLLASKVYQYVRLIRLTEGTLQIALDDQAEDSLPQDLRKELMRITGRLWMISIDKAGGAPPLAQQKDDARNAAFAEVLRMPMVQELLQVFPDAQLTDIKSTKE